LTRRLTPRKFAAADIYERWGELTSCVKWTRLNL
jgi:hypothetical protein